MIDAEPAWVRQAAIAAYAHNALHIGGPVADVAFDSVLGGGSTAGLAPQLPRQVSFRAVGGVTVGLAILGCDRLDIRVSISPPGRFWVTVWQINSGATSPTALSLLTGEDGSVRFQLPGNVTASLALKAHPPAQGSLRTAWIPM